MFRRLQRRFNLTDEEFVEAASYIQHDWSAGMSGGCKFFCSTSLRISSAIV